MLTPAGTTDRRRRAVPDIFAEIPKPKEPYA